MPLSRVSLRSFLSTAKASLKTAGQKGAPPVTFVIGNESADLDSICSAVVLAYLRTYAPTSKSNTLYIPLSNLPHADLTLRPELHPVFSRANLKLSDLITLSDLPQTPPLTTENTRWVLVDHNALQGELGTTYATRVVGCIDHHDEENKVPQNTGDEPRIVRKSGSCSSLVVDYCKDAWKALSTEAQGQNKESLQWNSELAFMAITPILMDTINLTSKSKTTTDDTDAVRYLKDLITAVPGNRFDQDEYFEEVSKAKEDIGSLSINGILRKDYKQWAEGSMNLGVSSSVKDIQFLLGKAGSQSKFLDEVRTFAKERDLSMCSIMTTYHLNGNFRRELFVMAVDAKGSKVARDFQRDYTETLGLETWNEGILDSDIAHEWRCCWWQQNVSHSRKQVAPLMRTAMR